MGVQPLLDAAETRRSKLADKLDKLTATPQAEGRTALTSDEAAKFERYAGELADLDRQIEAFRAQVAREATAAAATAPASTAPAVVTSEPRTYDEHGSRGASFMRDLAAIMVPQAGLDQAAASERMARHHRELEVDSRRDAEVRRRLEEITRTPDALRQEQRVNPNTSYGQGGRNLAAAAA